MKMGQILTDFMITLAKRHLSQFTLSWTPLQFQNIALYFIVQGDTMSGFNFIDPQGRSIQRHS